MNRAKIFIAFSFLLAFAVQVLAQTDPSKIYWKNVNPRYKKFNEIKPILVNGSDKSIYLHKIYPYYNAHLQRLNEETQKWEAGAKGIGCATVEKPFEPIEIKPNEERPVELAWELSTDNFEKPKFFELQDHETLRPLVGKYKIYLAYALDPWTLMNKPKQTYSVSAEFEIIKKN